MKIEIISIFLIFFSVIAIILGIVKLHTYPGRIADQRNHPQTDAIKVTSLLGLLIFPLWMMALIWAYSGAIVGSMYRSSEPDHKEASDQNEDTVPVVATKG
jgi:hypothetical protein